MTAPADIEPNVLRFLDFAALCWVRPDQIEWFSYATLRPEWLLCLHYRAVLYGNSDLAALSGAWVRRRGLMSLN